MFLLHLGNQGVPTGLEVWSWPQEDLSSKAWTRVGKGGQLVFKKFLNVPVPSHPPNASPSSSRHQP